MEAPTMAGYGSATDLAPQDAYRPLLGASWPELARRYLQEHTALTISQEAVGAVVRLKVSALGKRSSSVMRSCQGSCLAVLPSSPAKGGAVEVTVRRHAVGVFLDASDDYTGGVASVVTHCCCQGLCLTSSLHVLYLLQIQALM